MTFDDFKATVLAKFPTARGRFQHSRTGDQWEHFYVRTMRFSATYYPHKNRVKWSFGLKGFMHYSGCTFDDAVDAAIDSISTTSKQAAKLGLLP